MSDFITRATEQLSMMTVSTLHVSLFSVYSVYVYHAPEIPSFTRFVVDVVHFLEARAKSHLNLDVTYQTPMKIGTVGPLLQEKVVWRKKLSLCKWEDGIGCSSA